MLRKFVEELKKGRTQSQAAQKAGYKNPADHACELIRNPLVVEAMEEYRALERKAEEKAVQKAAENRGMSRAEVYNILSDIAREGESESARVRAAISYAELKGWKVNRIADVSREFEGRSEEELEFFATNGYWPEEKQSVERAGAGATGLESGSPQKG